MVGDGLRHQIAVAGAAGNERDLAGDQEAETGRQIVEHDHRLAGIDQLMHHVAADIAGPARDQNRHDPCPLIFRDVIPGNHEKEHLDRAHEPVSDIYTVAVDSLKVLDPIGRLPHLADSYTAAKRGRLMPPPTDSRSLGCFGHIIAGRSSR